MWELINWYSSLILLLYFFPWYFFLVLCCAALKFWDVIVILAYFVMLSVLIDCDYQGDCSEVVVPG